jgi:uncharacterized membrane protein YedE/YeeE
MQNILVRERWSPYVVGASLGVLSWMTFWAMGSALGVSTTMVRVAGLVESVFSADHVLKTAYFMNYFKRAEAFEWQFALVLMLPFGAWAAARLSGSRRVEHVPFIWKKRFGENRWQRYLWAFLGGVILLFGARLAGGCTSGHGISGGLQLSLSSWLFLAAMFCGGVATAFPLYRK